MARSSRGFMGRCYSPGNGSVVVMLASGASLCGVILRLGRTTEGQSLRPGLTDGKGIGFRDWPGQALMVS
jgi:hypothetical protein